MRFSHFASGMFLFFPWALIHWIPPCGYRKMAYEETSSLASTIWKVLI